ncbi:UNVERIFIED_CONTAM: hypothetical protein Sangu_1162300 [Sesamum angustifolium]|uniref:Reverse transcriptase domain-containing protein n=1 Tax=Sesamum angustifolium TaxID=2727405 RepID=A0AAW2P2C3_9LAMI
MKQPSKPPLKGFVPSTQEEEGGHEALAIDEKGFDLKAFKLLIKAGYDPKEKLNLGKLPPEATSKKLLGLNATQIMLKEKGHAIQDSRVDHKRKENLRESVFNRLGPHRKELHGIANRQSVFDRLGPCKRVRHQKKKMAVVRLKKKTPKMLAELEEGTKATMDELKEVNLGDIENPRPVYISASLTHGEEGTYIALLNEFKDVFAWSYKEMPGEVNKLIEVGFIRKVKYPMWISSIVRKKEEWTNLSHEALSFMDGLSGYNQIRMAPIDEELTAFALLRIFDDMLHKNVECYVDDLVVKSKKQENHFHELRKVFERLRRYQLKMNPSKCAFGVTSEKFLRFIIRQRGIEIEQAKIDAILRIPEPRNIHELKSLQGKLAYLRRFISNLAGRCQPFSRLMKKDVPFQWDEACEKAFKSIKSYLMKHPVLVAPVPGRPLILYVAAQERCVGILLAQKNDEERRMLCTT